MVQTRITHSHKLERGFQNQKNSGFKQAISSGKLFIPYFSKIIFPLVTTSLWLASPFASAQQSLPTPLLSQKSPANSVSSPRLLASGTQVSLNGRTLPGAWSQWQNQGIRTWISDAGATQLGMELLNTQDEKKQPVQWFSEPKTMPLVLPSWLTAGARYLDVTDFAQKAGWQVQASGNTLQISSPLARVQTIRQGRQPWGDRIVLDLNRPTSWQIQQQSVSKTSNQEWTITIDAATAPALIQAFNPSPSHQLLNNDTSQTRILKKVETTLTLTTIRLSVPSQLSPRVTTLSNPDRLVIDLRSDSMVERDILWAKGLRWRQKFLNLGSDRFPVVWLEINPRTTGLTLKPITSEATTLVGIAPLIKTALAHSAAAAINGGFFNRKNQSPLGAIRRDGRWLSSPILNRGAIAWNDSGLVKINRLSLKETIITSTGRLPVLSFNSGYVQAGIARYSSEWGSTYTPLVDNEIIVVVQNNQVTAQLPAGIAGKATFPIPSNGYLLVLRANNNTAASSLQIGTLVREESASVPADFGRYPHIIGAGPVLVQNRQIVLDAKSEGFSDAFIREKAARSAIGVTSSGTLLIAAVHNRAGGAGPTLSEIAKVMQQMGCVDALNFDGGSSTSLYLGGQLLNRSPLTAARVHNGLGVFLQPLP